MTSGRSQESSMPVALELPETQSVGRDELVGNFPQIDDDVKPTEGRLQVRVNLDSFDRHIIEKHVRENFYGAYDTRGSPTRGLCLIINNREFERQRERIGTDVDRDNSHRLFSQLGYSVTVLNNQTADQMKSACKDFILDPEHGNHNSCVLILLSHGTLGKILGSDSKPVDEKADILDHFNAKECRLVGKPKLVIVQACRIQLASKNKNTQYPDEVVDGPVPESSKESFDLIDSMRRLNYKDAEFLENSLTPDFADLIIAHSTLPGYVSWRHTGQGSWFVQAIVQIFSRNFKDEHVGDLLVQVNQLISEVFGRNVNSQMPCPINHLRKKFYFFPN